MVYDLLAKVYALPAICFAIKASASTRSAAIFALDGLKYYDEELPGYRVSRLMCAALRSEVSEFRREALL